jgi:anti-sigma factor RsiW
MMEYPPGWTCEVTVARIERYVMRTLPRPDALAVAEHIEACAACAQLVALLRTKAGTARSGRRSGRR